MFCKAGSRRHGKKNNPSLDSEGKLKLLGYLLIKTIEIPMGNCNEDQKDKKSLNRSF